MEFLSSGPNGPCKGQRSRQQYTRRGNHASVLWNGQAGVASIELGVCALCALVLVGVFVVVVLNHFESVRSAIPSTAEGCSSQLSIGVAEFDDADQVQRVCWIRAGSAVKDGWIHRLRGQADSSAASSMQHI